MTKLRDERGVSAVVVAICLVAIFGAALLSVDAGALFTARRGMVTATDTAALTGARAAVGQTAVGPCPAPVLAAVTTRLVDQQPDATLDACTLTPTNAKSGYLTVDARRPVELKFGAILGLGTQSAFSSTSVAYGYPSGASGLRPIGICIQNGHIQEWLALKQILADGDTSNDAAAQAAYDLLKGILPPSVDPNPHPNYSSTFPASGVVHRVYFEKDNGGDCGSLGDAAGNWGWMDFNGGSNTNIDTRNWLQTGFDGEVGVHLPVPHCLVEDPPDGCLNGTTGDKGNAMDTELANLTTNQVKFYVPIFDAAVANGNNVVFTIRAFVGVILRGYTHGNDGFFDVEFYDAIFSGGCCSDSGIATGALATRICAVDHDATSEAVRCTPD